MKFCLFFLRYKYNIYLFNIHVGKIYTRSEKQTHKSEFKCNQKKARNEIQ